MSVKTLSTNSSDVTTRVRILDATTGLPATGITHATGGLGIYYQRELAAQVAVTPASLAAVTSPHTDGGFIEIGDGWYRVDLPDAAFSGSMPSVAVGVTLSGHVAFGPTVLIEPSVAVSVDSWSIGGALIAGDVATYITAHDTAIDAQLAAISAAVAALPTAGANAAAVAATVVEGAVTLVQAQRAMLAALVGKVSGAASNAPAFRDIGDTKNRISATTDADGNRTAVTLDLS